jgi:hypothetical protein
MNHSEMSLLLGMWTKLKTYWIMSHTENLVLYSKIDSSTREKET